MQQKQLEDYYQGKYSKYLINCYYTSQQCQSCQIKAQFIASYY